MNVDPTALNRTNVTFQRRHFVGFDFTMFKDDEVLRAIRAQAHQSRFSYVVTPNTDHVVNLEKLDGTGVGYKLREAYAAADLCLCDSRILVKLARLSGVRLDLLPGSDLTRLLFEETVIRAGDRVAVIGGAADQVDWLREQWPEIAFFGHVPPMGVLRSREAQDAIIAFVEQAQCQFYLFAFGAPQSELVAWRLAKRGKAQGVALCIGASIEFLSGAKARAPHYVQELSLEWAFRLATEPRRLWRRYMVDGPRILPIWWRDRVARRHRS